MSELTEDDLKIIEYSLHILQESTEYLDPEINGALTKIHKLREALSAEAENGSG